MKSILLSCASLAAALFTSTWLAPAVHAAQAADEPMLLAFADGSTLWGRIAGHDAERVTFERLDTGGIARVPWTRLDPEQAGTLLQHYGYVDHSGDELMVEADKLTLADGADVIGKIINRTPTELYVKTSTRIMPVPLMRLRGAITTVQVPALDVYTREELYRSEASKLLKDSAESQFELARFCERIYDFAHALTHYQAALALDPSFKQDDLKAALTRAQAKAANQEQLDFLYKIDSMRARGQYDKALAACDEFDQKYETSPLRGDNQKRRTSVKKAREQALRELVTLSCYKWAERLTAAKARDPQMTLEASLAYLEDGLKNELQAAVLKDAQRAVGASVQAEDVNKLWIGRKEGRFRRASYGLGTWLLGDKAAQAGLEPEKKDGGPKTEADKERLKLEEKLKRYLQNQQIVKQKNTGGEGEKSEQEVFWSEWNSFARGQWMLAYYAEHGGDMHLKNVSFSACADCNGEGVRDIINTGSARSDSNQGGGRARSGSGGGANSASNQFIECPMCHGVRVQRRVNFW